MPVDSGERCARAFFGAYHAWSYGLDGSLKKITGSHGFRGVNVSERGLIQISTKQKGGIVDINQESNIDDDFVDASVDFSFNNQNISFKNV
jgi:phenylpropionate dioxygenase-like ring-hydroxylating dioxygenase large terminal subunit